MAWQLRGTSYPLHAAFIPVWNWTFAETVPAGGTLEGPRVFIQDAPASGPTDEYMPGRYCVTGLARVTSGSAYFYYSYKMIGSVTRLYKVWGATVNNVTYLGAQPLHRIPAVDEWFVTIIERSGANPADVEGTFTMWSRGFNFG